MVPFYRIIGTAVPLYYRFIWLLWVGPSVQPSLITVFLEENENELCSGTHIELESACSVILTKGVWGFLVCGDWERKLPRPPCCQGSSEVQTLLLALLCNTVWMFAFSQHPLRRTLGTSYFSLRNKNCPFPLGVWKQQRKPLMVQSFVKSTTAWIRESQHCFKLIFPLEKPPLWFCHVTNWQKSYSFRYIVAKMDHVTLVHLQLLRGLWAWRPGMWCWSSHVRGCVPGARTHKHSPGSPLANSHCILTVRPAVLFTLSAATHPLLLKQQPGRQELACSSVVKASDLRMTLVLERLSSKASEVLHKLWERQTDRETDSLLDWLR